MLLAVLMLVQELVQFAMLNDVNHQFVRTLNRIFTLTTRSYILSLTTRYVFTRSGGAVPSRVIRRVLASRVRILSSAAHIHRSRGLLARNVDVLDVAWEIFARVVGNVFAVVALRVVALSQDESFRHT